MGWNTVGCDLDKGEVHAAADARVPSGMRAGYRSGRGRRLLVRATPRAGPALGTGETQASGGSVAKRAARAGCDGGRRGTGTTGAGQ